MMQMNNQLYFASRDDWRSWLEQNHATAREAWLVHYKKGTGKPGVSYEDAVEEALCFGWIDSLLRSIDQEKYALRYSPRKRNAVWSEANKRRVERMIEQGRMTEAGLTKVRQAKESGEWHNAASREKLEIPSDLEKALAGNNETALRFQQLTPSRRKQLIWWVTGAKRKETRQKRINEVIRLVEQYRDGKGN